MICLIIWAIDECIDYLIQYKNDVSYSSLQQRHSIGTTTGSESVKTLSPINPIPVRCPANESPTASWAHLP